MWIFHTNHPCQSSLLRLAHIWGSNSNCRLKNQCISMIFQSNPHAYLKWIFDRCFTFYLECFKITNVKISWRSDSSLRGLRQLGYFFVFLPNNTCMIFAFRTLYDVFCQLAMCNFPLRTRVRFIEIIHFEQSCVNIKSKKIRQCLFHPHCRISYTLLTVHLPTFL